MSDNFEFMQPIVTGWLGKIEEAKKHKKPFDSIAEQCSAFFSADTGFMWEPKFRNKYLQGSLNPKFRMTMAKAFELVAIFGPTLYWKNPERYIRPRESLKLDPSFFGPEQDPTVVQMYQQAEMEQQSRSRIDSARASLMELYLNYTPGEMPNGGLASHAERAITEALVKGRGCLWPKPYKMPGSDRTLTGCFYDSVDNLLIDPDVTELDDAMWIAQECTVPIWKAEEDLGLRKGELEGKGTMESATAQGERAGHDMAPFHRKQGLTNDLITYYKVYSKMGVGGRLTGVRSTLSSSFDRVIGDYAYIVVSPNVPYPLNAPSYKIRTSYDEDVEKMFRWPVPYWMDDRWPVAVLDFYQNPASVWPIAPLAPGLGELVFLNVLVSHMANRIWTSSRDFIAVVRDAAKEVESTIKSGDDQCIIKLDDVHRNINEVVQFLQQPQTNKDMWSILDRVMEIFDKRVGLSELLYGLNPAGTQPRSATEVTSKKEAVSVRPDYMASKVENWMEDNAELEKFACRWFVEPKDLNGLFGPAEQFLWERYVTGESPEIIVREMQATVAAGSVRKPNKERDAQNMNAIMPSLMPELSKHADVTGDTNPLNNLLKSWGDAIDQDMSPLEMGPRQQQPSEEEQQAMQQQMQLEMQKLQSEAEGKQADVQIKGIEYGIKQIELQIKQGEAQETGVDVEAKKLELMFDAAQHQQDISQDGEQHTLDILQKEAEGQLKLAQMREQGQLKLEQQRQQAKIQAQAAKQQMKAAAQKNRSSNSGAKK